jgi:hypothetical protein
MIEIWEKMFGNFLGDFYGVFVFLLEVVRGVPDFEVSH